MTDWTPERIAAAKEKRAATMAAKAAKKVEPETKANGSETDSQQSTAIKARWASEKAGEQDLRQTFAQIAIEEGMQMIAKMRGNTEIAAQVLNQRITGDAAREKCKTCGGERKNNKDWILRRPYRDHTTQQIVTECFCSMTCVALENQKKQGTYGVSDRGMLQTDNQKSQPTDPTAQ